MIRTWSARLLRGSSCSASKPRMSSPSMPKRPSSFSPAKGPDEPAAMNLQSEIDYFRELAPIGQARLLAVFLHELSMEARGTYGSNPEHVQDGARLRFVNE